MSNIVVYFKADQSVSVSNRKVKIEDIGKIYCKDKDIEYEINKMEVFKFDESNNSQQVVSILKIVELIQNKFKDVSVENMGEADFIIYYKIDEKTRGMQIVNVIFVCLIAFLGGGYSIMSYNTDVNAVELFGMLHELFIGEPPKGPSIIELAYCVGLLVGVIIFFNHGANKKISDDPTPLQVQMRMYEQNVNESIIIDAGRKKDALDVD